MSTASQMITRTALCGLVAAIMGASAAAKVYEPNWESLDARPTPAWWSNQKFSLFMHWGLYAVPSYCPVTPSSKTCYAEHFWDTSHTNGSAQQEYALALLLQPRTACAC